MPDFEVEVMLENHPHLFVVEVDSVLEAQLLQGTVIKFDKCDHRVKVTHIGTPGRKERQERQKSDGQKSIFKE